MSTLVILAALLCDVIFIFIPLIPKKILDLINTLGAFIKSSIKSTKKKIVSNTLEKLSIVLDRYPILEELAIVYCKLIARILFVCVRLPEKLIRMAAKHILFPSFAKRRSIAAAGYLVLRSPGIYRNLEDIAKNLKIFIKGKTFIFYNIYYAPCECIGRRLLATVMWLKHRTYIDGVDVWSMNLTELSFLLDRMDLIQEDDEIIKCEYMNIEKRHSI